MAGDVAKMAADINKMAAVDIEKMAPGEAEKEKLLATDKDKATIMPPAVIVEDDGLSDGLGVLISRPVKKVKLPEPQAGGRFTIGEPMTDDEDNVASQFNGEWEMKPPDGGWGWFILVGATVVNILVPGVIKSFGVLFVIFLEKFNAGQAAASGIPALCYFLYSSLGPLSSVLSVKYSYRTVTLIGGCFAAFGMILSSFAWSIGYLYVSYGLMVGTGAGLSFPPTVYIVTSYFERRRGFANGICISGSAFGSIILPPLLIYLLDEYGYRSAVLLMGGIMLNVWAAALFFQPVEMNMIRVPKLRDVSELPPQLEPFDEEEDEMLEGDLPRNQTVTSMENSSDNHKPRVILTSEDSTPEKTASVANGGVDVVRSVSAAHIQDRRRKVSIPGSSSYFPSMASRGTFGSRSQIKSSASLALESVPEGKYRMGSQEMFGRKLSIPKTPKRSPSTSSFQYVSTPFHGSTLSAFQQPNDFASQLTLKSITESLAPISYCCGLRKRKPKPKQDEPNKYFDITVLKDPTYLVILASNCTNAISYTNFIILLPAYASALGYDKSQGAYLLSIVSALDLIGRIGGSAISDLELIPKTWYFVGGLLVSGISLATIPLVPSYMGICVCCSIFGLASGIYVGVTSLIMAELLGTERFTSTYGISLFVNGILQLVGPFVCGIWYEMTQDYYSLFLSLGVILQAGAALWILMPFIKKDEKKNTAK